MSSFTKFPQCASSISYATSGMGTGVGAGSAEASSAGGSGEQLECGQFSFVGGQDAGIFSFFVAGSAMHAVLVLVPRGRLPPVPQQPGLRAAGALWKHGELFGPLRDVSNFQ